MKLEAVDQRGSSALFDEHSPNAFAYLNDFHVARQALECSKDAINILGGVICKHRFEDVIGINLLHKHYDIDDNEVVVRSFHGNKALMRPRLRSEIEQSVVPYLWAYISNGLSPGWYPVEYVELSPERCGGLELLKYASPLLLELGAKLCELGLQDLPGIAGLYSRDAFVVPQGYSLLETTNEPMRTLTLESVPECYLRGLDTTQTLWIFELHHNNKAQQKRS